LIKQFWSKGNFGQKVPKKKDFAPGPGKRFFQEKKNSSGTVSSTYCQAIAEILPSKNFPLPR